MEIMNGNYGFTLGMRGTGGHSNNKDASWLIYET